MEPPPIFFTQFYRQEPGDLGEPDFPGCDLDKIRRTAPAGLMERYVKREARAKPLQARVLNAAGDVVAAFHIVGEKGEVRELPAAGRS